MRYPYQFDRTGICYLHVKRVIDKRINQTAFNHLSLLRVETLLFQAWIELYSNEKGSVCQYGLFYRILF